jgi:hypothetical protein
MMIEARIDSRERRSRKKSLTAVDGVVRLRHGETTAAGYRNEDSRGKREREVMLIDRLEVGNGWALCHCHSWI